MSRLGAKDVTAISATLLNSSTTALLLSTFLFLWDASVRVSQHFDRCAFDDVAFAAWVRSSAADADFAWGSLQEVGEDWNAVDAVQERCVLHARRDHRAIPGLLLTRCSVCPRA